MSFVSCLRVDWDNSSKVIFFPFFSLGNSTGSKLVRIFFGLIVFSSSWIVLVILGVLLTFSSLKRTYNKMDYQYRQGFESFSMNRLVKNYNRKILKVWAMTISFLTFLWRNLPLHWANVQTATLMSNKAKNIMTDARVILILQWSCFVIIHCVVLVHLVHNSSLSTNNAILIL